ncbi:cystatin-A1-like [Xyrauchen texanus]|uniref:cystatin-A1-like n=1 Tax=Xyrauchen texanus TaxID=154827 RepID=UPI002241DEBE|nr:cystatin-A1-like [Xyrauchen texanus]
MDIQMPGGWSKVEPATPEVKKITQEVKEQVVALSHGANFKVFNAVSFSSQTVAGTNYIIKVNVGGDVCVHVMVFKAISSQEKLKVQRIQHPKKRSDPLKNF